MPSSPACTLKSDDNTSRRERREKMVKCEDDQELLGLIERYKSVGLKRLQKLLSSLLHFRKLLFHVTKLG